VQRGIYLTILTKKNKMATINATFLLNNFGNTNEQGRVIGLDYMKLASKKAIVSPTIPIEGYDAVEEEITLHGVRFKVVTTFGPNGSEVSAFVLRKKLGHAFL
jgi:hypothetical protein